MRLNEIWGGGVKTGISGITLSDADIFRLRCIGTPSFLRLCIFIIYQFAIFVVGLNTEVLLHKRKEYSVYNSFPFIS